MFCNLQIRAELDERTYVLTTTTENMSEDLDGAIPI